MAARDTIAFNDFGAPTVVERGHNVAIQLYGPHDTGDLLTPDVDRLSGAMDARPDALTIYTIPVSVGFAEIERTLEYFVVRYPDMEWYFANVYADDGVTPLNWW